MTTEKAEDEIVSIQRQLKALEQERERLAARLAQLMEARCEESRPAASEAAVTSSSPAAEKIALFRQLFAGRTDVLPVR